MIIEEWNSLWRMLGVYDENHRTPEEVFFDERLKAIEIFDSLYESISVKRT